MSHACLQIATAPDRRQEVAGAGDGVSRRAFSLIELMVVVTIMSLLVGLLGAALSGARVSSKKQQTQLLISKLDAIIQQQFSTYAARAAKMPRDTNQDGRPDLPAGFTAAAYRSWYIRRNLISGDLPDNWADVTLMASRARVGFGSGEAFPLTAPQRAYVELYRGLAGTVTPAWGDAECLFMIVMQGGVANCLDCGELKTADRGDKDGDGAYEFWDSWGNPIGFVLWPAGIQLPAGAGTAFFSGARQPEDAFPTMGVYPSPGLGLRPLIYSAGPDGIASIGVSTGNLSLGMDCGNPINPTVQALGRYLNDPKNPGDFRSDNITNFDQETGK